MTRHLLAILMFVMGCAAAAGPASAQTLSLQPAVVALKGSAGQTVTRKLTLHNGSEQALEFDLVVQDVVVKGGKRVMVEAGQLPASIAATAVIRPQRVRVEAGQSASTEVMFTVPRDLQHRAAVAMFRGRTLLKTGLGTAGVSLGALFTFQVSDAVHVTGELRPKPPTATSNAAFVGALLNEGAEPVVPTGVVAVIDGQGRMVGKANFSQRRLLPGESAELVAELAAELDKGDYRAVASFDLDGKPFTLTAPLTVP